MARFLVFITQSVWNFEFFIFQIKFTLEHAIIGYRYNHQQLIRFKEF